MIQKVLITVKGTQMMPGPIPESENEEPIELVTVGTLEEKDGILKLSYEETFDADGLVTQDEVTISGQRVEVDKKGVISCHMIFEEGIRSMTFYETPFGELPMGMTASYLSVTEEMGCPQIEIHYSLTVAEQYTAECILNIKTKAAG